MASRLEFQPGNHTYWMDGERVPSVTTVIGKAHDKPGLSWWAAEEAAKWAVDNLATLDETRPAPWIREARRVHNELKTAAAKRGTLLHDAARQLVAGAPITPETEGEPWPDAVVDAAGQLARFMDDWDVDPLLAERPVFHELHRWAGTVDLVATLRDGRTWLLDYKTGKSGIYPKDALQLAAYRHASHVQVEAASGELFDRGMTQVDECACVWIQPDFYELRPVLADWPSYDVFLHMLPVARWTDWKREETVGSPLPVPEAS